MNSQFSYTDSADRCYGATGMAIALVIFDGEEKLASIDIDREPRDVVELTEESFFSGNPSMSAKHAWHQILSNFNLQMAMLMGNVMCRSILLRHVDVDADTRSALLSLLVDEGYGSCSLEEDETTHLFNKNYGYLHRVFSHYGVQTIAHDFAAELGRCHSMTRGDIIEKLQALSHL
ncbi:MAG: hypothetical protein K2J17_00280 [Paramuribaculum sp.]|nr:hypothetical protein [Paramuribaculum sp.]